MRVIIDTSAWIEYFQGSKEGETVNQYVNYHNLTLC